MNPALPGGASDGPDATATDSWAVQTRLAYTFVPYGRLQQGTAEAPNPNDLAIDVHLGSLQLTGTAPTGTSIDVQLPFGSLRTTTFMEARTDTGVGDLELRARQAFTRWLRSPRLSGTVGLVLPSGRYVERSGAANLPAEAATLTLGRGVTWALAEVDGQLAIGSRGAVFGQLSGRAPLNRTRDEFAWGSELRATLGGSIKLDARWSLLASTDLQWRGNASEPDPFTMGRVDSANAGGLWWSATPGVRCAVASGIVATAGVRFAIAADVVGNQLVPQAGGFVALSYGFAPTARRSTPTQTTTATPMRAVAGRITVVDYWATWCKPCAQIHAALETAAPRWPDVEITRIDATEWPAPTAPPLPDGIAGLPVIEIFDTTGRRTHLLVGPEALRVVEIVDTLRKGTTP